MSTTTKTQFHWVHKDTQSQSLSNTSGSESREIRKFVQHQRLATRRVGELQIKFSKQQAVSSSSNISSLQTRTGRSRRGSSEPEITKTSLSSSSESRSAETRLSDEQNNDAYQGERKPIREKKVLRRHVLRRRQSSPGTSRSSSFTSTQAKWRIPHHNFMEGSAVDPFNRTPQLITRDASTMLQYFSSVQLQGGNPYKLQHLPNRVKSVTPIYAVRDEFISNAMQYEHCMYALFSFMSVRLLHITKLQLKGLKDPVYYMSKAISALRRRLDEYQESDRRIDSATIGAIAQITLADWTSGDLAAAKIHLGMLAHVLQYVDIDSPTGRYMIETIRTADFQVAVEGHTKPMLNAIPSFEPMSRQRITELEAEVHHAAEEQELKHSENVASRLGQDPGQPVDILADLETTLDLRLGWALEEILTTDIICLDLHPTIRNMLDCVTIMKCVWRLETATLRDARIMCRWGRTQGHFLFTYGYNHADDDATPQTLLTDCVRLALLVLLTLATNRMASRAARRIGYELFDACQKVELSPNAPELAASSYLWALITAAMVVKEKTAVKSWLLNRAADTAIQLDLRSYEDIHHAMTGFLYSFTFYLQTVREVLDMINAKETTVLESLAG